ncbi:MAG TPA: hypothetical protein VHG72_03495 [Polyangia bacterium]|nr:hypothetical protein [Polyangia bacterium]
MVRNSCFILGIVLGVFWWVGLSQNHNATVLWFNAVAAVLSFGVAALLPDPERSPSRAAGPAILGLGLAVLWIVGMAGGQPAWANWINFVLAVAYMGVALGSIHEHGRLVHATR